MVKPKYLRHPFRTALAARALFATRLSMWQFASDGQRRFRGDARYDLQNVTDGFVSRIDDSDDDAKLLERICAAYISAVKQEQFASEAYGATEWWRQVRQQSLAPVMRALLTRDVDALGRMYRNFFRDPCSTGLLAAPYGMSQAYFGGEIKNVYRHFYLSLALRRIDYWMVQTDERFALCELDGPQVGNPFGVHIDGTHIRAGAEYAHYCAHRIVSLLDSESATVAEIGGGFGGMAYYLLRDRPRVTYIDFDVPESIALTSYYLLKSFPQLQFLLYGEAKLTMGAIAQADVVLMPVFELATMPAESVDVTFSSHTMSDISSEAMVEYLNNIERVTRDSFLHIGNQRAGESISALMCRRYNSLELAETRPSDWHVHKAFGADVGNAGDLAASTIFEQCYVRRTASRNESAKLYR
jgi:hypothetical protein